MRRALVVGGLVLALVVLAITSSDDGGTDSDTETEAAADGGDDDGEAVDAEVIVVGADDEEAALPQAEPRTLADAPLDDPYLETFDGPESVDTLDFFVSNGRSYDFRPATWPGDHDTSNGAGTCGTPDTTREISWPDPPGDDTPTVTENPGETAYWCAPGGEGTGHLMTAFHTGGYAHLDFSPRRTFTDVAQICFDINTTNLGNRQWPQVVVASADLAAEVAPRLDWTHPTFRDDDGPASWGMEVTDGVFMFMSLQGGAEVMTGGGPRAAGDLNDLSVADNKKRTTTCLTDRDAGEIEISQERWSGDVDVTVLPGSFPDGEVRVVFQDASYNPLKANEESPPAFEGFTWHWDNLYVSSTVER